MTMDAVENAAVMGMLSLGAASQAAARLNALQQTALTVDASNATMDSWRTNTHSSTSSENMTAPTTMYTPQSSPTDAVHQPPQYEQQQISQHAYYVQDGVYEGGYPAPQQQQMDYYQQRNAAYAVWLQQQQYMQQVYGVHPGVVYQAPFAQPFMTSAVRGDQQFDEAGTPAQHSNGESIVDDMRRSCVKPAMTPPPSADDKMIEEKKRGRKLARKNRVKREIDDSVKSVKREQRSTSAGSSCKEFVKDARYYERRQRNNIAAKKSRDARKTREDEILRRCQFLEVENSHVRSAMGMLMQEVMQLRSTMDAATSAAIPHMPHVQAQLFAALCEPVKQQSSVGGIYTAPGPTSTEYMVVDMPHMDENTSFGSTSTQPIAASHSQSGSSKQAARRVKAEPFD